MKKKLSLRQSSRIWGESIRRILCSSTRVVLLSVAMFFGTPSTLMISAQPCDCEYDESPCQTETFNVFISYSGFDREIVSTLSGELRSRQIPYWDYQESCAIGSNCDLDNIRAVIEDSELIVIIRSSSWHESDICKKEMKFIEAFKHDENTDHADRIEDLLNKIINYHKRFPDNYAHIFIEYGD